MNRYRTYSPAALLVGGWLLGSLAACGGGDAAQTPPLPPVPEGQPAETTQAPPELPADLQEVSQQLAAAQAAAASSGAELGPSGALTATGELVSPVRSELVARTPGRVSALLVDEGQRVRRGQPLLRLETQYLEPELARAEAELSRTRAALAEAESDFGRKEELLQRGTVPQAIHDRSASAYQQAQAAVAAAQAARDLARQRLDDAVLTSPVDGVVAARQVDVGERLGDNTVAFVLVQTTPLRLRFDLPERYLPAVAAGQPVTARVDPYPGETFRGRVVMVGQVVDSASRAFRVEAEIPNADGRLRPGLFARVTLEPEAAPAEGGVGEDAGA